MSAGLDERSPAELREMLGANLRQLAQRAPSVSALCRELGINRTQFNRYLAAESFPRPDVLHRICRYFDVDARILLEPLSSQTVRADLIGHPEIEGFIGAFSSSLPESVFPSGFFLFSRRSFVADDRFVMGLVYIYRRDGITFLRGYEAREAMRQQNLPETAEAREFRGVVVPQESGVSAYVSRRGARTVSFNYLSPLPAIETNHWAGYTTRTVPAATIGRRVTRLVYEHLGRNGARARAAARRCGLCGPEDLPELHRRHLTSGLDEKV